MDSDQDTHRERAAQRQAIIAEVVRTHAGEPIPQIMDLLQERMADRGLQPPPGQVARGGGPGCLRRADLRREQRGDGRLGHRHPLAATRERAGQQENSGGGPKPSRVAPTAEGGQVRDHED